MSTVLIIEDQPGDLSWLADLLRSRGYQVVEATNGQAGLDMLDRVHEALGEGSSPFILGIFDIMVATNDIRDLSTIGDDFLEKSKRMGLDLCRYARQTLKIPAKQFPIVCHSALSEDPEVIEELERLEIPRFNKNPRENQPSIRDYIKKNLPVIR